MRIRPNIPDRLLAKAKRYAAKRGISLSQLAIEALEEKFSKERQAQPTKDYEQARRRALVMLSEKCRIEIATPLRGSR